MAGLSEAYFSLKAEASGTGRAKVNRASMHPYWRTKKDGTNGLAVRAGRPVTQTTSNLGGGKLYRLLNWNIYNVT
jgi:hypothetical protein